MSKKIEFTTVITELDTPEDLSLEDRELLAKAAAAAENAYAPYSAFYVGAALRLENNVILTGNNQENVAYPSGLCAERVVAFSAGAHYPDIPVSAVAITAKSPKFEVNKPLAPCGACRQVLAEYESRYNNRIRVIMMGERGKIFVVESVKMLLPLLFNEEGLKKVR